MVAIRYKWRGVTHQYTYSVTTKISDAIDAVESLFPTAQILSAVKR